MACRSRVDVLAEAAANDTDGLGQGQASCGPPVAVPEGLLPSGSKICSGRGRHPDLGGIMFLTSQGTIQAGRDKNAHHDELPERVG
jgi:hypothetical protein